MTAVNDDGGKRMEEISMSNDGGSDADNKTRFRDFWERVLKGEEEAQRRLYEYIKAAVQSVATRRSEISADSLVQTVARTIFRRVSEAQETVAPEDLSHFFNLIRRFGSYKLSNAGRKIDRYRDRVTDLPTFVDDQGTVQTLDPADESTPGVEAQLILREWSDAYLDAVEQLEEPKRTIMKTLMDVAYSDSAGTCLDKVESRKPLIRKLYEKLKEKGLSLTEAALRQQVRRIGRRIILSLRDK
jgi:uncharacterized protein (UPF0335 family)